MRLQRGFTLIELVTVIVVLSIVAAIGSGFVISALDSYRDTQERAKLLQKGRLAIEQMTRQLRLALPQSVRVSESGSCVEFLPIVGAARYLKQIPNDPASGGYTAGSFTTSPFTLQLGTPQYVSIGALSAEDIYQSGSPSAIAPLSSGAADPSGSVALATSHSFVRNSPNKRLFLVDKPMRFCVQGSNLMQYSAYDLVQDDMSDAALGTEVLIVDGVAPAGGGAFVLSDGSEDRGAAVYINLLFEQGAASVELNHQVLVRNVP